MTWYQSEQQHQEWKKLIGKQRPNIVQLMNSEEFCNQLIRNGNIEIMEWVQNNHVFFFGELLTRCLVLPHAEDSNQRKFKQPSQAIYLVCNLLDSMSIPSSGLPTSSISGSMACSMMGAGGKVASPQIITFIIQKMFALYLQNNPEELHSTLIPGHFNRIFQCLNRSQSPILIHTLKTTQQGKLEKLLQIHGKFEQIAKCIQTILIVFITQNGMFTNLQMSVNFPNSAPTMAPHPMPISSGQNHQPNHPYETKYRLLMNILMKIRNYRKIDIYLLENLISIALEIIKNSSNIFEGNHLADYVCQIENINVYFDIGLGSLCEDGTECQAKCLELLKYCMHTMSTVDRMNIYPKIKSTLDMIMRFSKPTIVMNLMLELINQWFLVQSNLGSCLFLNTSLSRSMSSNLSNSLRNSSSGLSSDAEELLCSNNIFKFLLRMCVTSPSCNIFHKKVAILIESVFRSQNISIINCIFKENDIIKETILNMKDFKANQYFGYFIYIVQIYTTRRIDTPVVNEIISLRNEIWEKFYFQILEPHMQKKIKSTLGEMLNVEDNHPLQFTVVKIDQKRGDSSKEQEITNEFKIIKKKDEVQQKPLLIQLDNSKKDSQKFNETQNQSDAIQPISLQFSKKQQEKKQEKTQTQSFQNFLKKKMGEDNKLVDERRKSRTPTKLVSGGGSKRKKWGTQNDENPGFEITKKSVSADEKLPNPTKIQQIIPKISLLKLSKKSKQNYPQKARERKLNSQNDSLLLKWLQRAKTQAKRVR